MKRFSLLILLFACCIPTSADDVVLVVGASGEKEFGEQFNEWKNQWEDICLQAEFPLSVIGPVKATEEASDRTRLEAKLSELAAEEDSTPLWIVLVGHGTWDGKSARFNLTGPDVSAKELANWLGATKRTVVVVNCSSSSGPFIDRLSGRNRVVVTATKSGNEQNYARFGKFFAEAASTIRSDLDHDDSVSVREAFIKAGADTLRFYREQGRLASEHALIDDNGDKRGSSEALLTGTAKTQKKDVVIDGDLAGKIVIPIGSEAVRLTPEQASQRQKLEKRLEELKLVGEALPEEEYHATALPILLQLAEIYREAEAAQQEEEQQEEQQEEVDAKPESEDQPSSTEEKSPILPKS